MAERNTTKGVRGGASGGGDASTSTGRATNDVELKNLLIDLVKEHPLIYDKSHKDHFRSNMRTEVFSDIGNILGIPGKSVLHSVLSICNSSVLEAKHVINTMYCRTSVRKKMEGSSRHLSKKA